MKMPKANSQWKKLLSEEQYKVLREKGTEIPGTSKLLKVKDPGMYKCAGCGNVLFPSNTKFDSGTGWPSFDSAIPNAVILKEDYHLGMHRLEVECAKCHSHLGHVFDDGPTKTGKRFCINGCALNFKKK